VTLWRGATLTGFKKRYRNDPDANKLREQLQPLLRMENCDYAHVVRRVIAQPLLTPWRAVPSGMRLEAAPKAARLGVGRTRLGTYTIIDRQEWEMDFIVIIFS
jgi:hypothetical protein